MRIGNGYDVHRLVPDRPLILGGVDIPYEMGLLGHSDADVLLHAIADSVLGAAGLGDIGRHFPDTDEKYKGMFSLKLLNEVVEMVSSKGYNVINIDAVVIAEKPKLSPYIEAMCENIAKACNLPASFVNVKATTEEGLGFTGRKEGISAWAVCCIDNK
ncbi:MAG: 2-C-methyl-D-erythritol 2,4-cyclodiphosphate synthase [Lachnospiraceae bacterium]|nr:2-C-methyl-D-erythritol 2,4-cyclodiphosphate synthase [Lachnospiraceae bacterium]